MTVPDKPSLDGLEEKWGARWEAEVMLSWPHPDGTLDGKAKLLPDFRILFAVPL